MTEVQVSEETSTNMPTVSCLSFSVRMHVSRTEIDLANFLIIVVASELAILILTLANEGIVLFFQCCLLLEVRVGERSS